MGKKSVGRQTLNMKKIFILVEGQTEEKFIKQILSPYFIKLTESPKILIPIIHKTKTIGSRPSFKGGSLIYSKVKKELLNLLNDGSSACVTTMFDYYALDKSFLGINNIPSGTSIQKVEYLEKALKDDINHLKFLSNILLHEFEALLFSEPEQIANAFNDSKNINILKGIRLSFKTPEEIDNSPETAPSKRIIKLYPNYDKPFYGALISKKTGVKKMLQECPHFNNWILNLEKI